MLLNVDKYKDISSDVKKTEILNRIANTMLTKFEIESPGGSTKYTAKMEFNDKKILINIVDGDLKGSSWTWTVLPYGKNSSYVIYSGRIRNYTFFIDKLIKKDESMDVAVNVSAMIKTIRLNKSYVEKNYSIP